MLRRVVTATASLSSSRAMFWARKGSPGNNTVSAMSPGSASMCAVRMLAFSWLAEETSAGGQRRQAQMRRQAPIRGPPRADDYWDTIADSSTW